jgi:hypothetical protein
MQSNTKSACLALLFLGLMTFADSATDSLLPALADDVHTQPGRWNLGTAALILRGVSGKFGASSLTTLFLTDSRSYRPICDWLSSHYPA